MAEHATHHDPAEAEMSGHVYDGIQEYDNPIPGWWHAIFMGSVLFSFMYVAVAHLSPLWPTRDQAFLAAEEKALELQFSELRQIPMGEEKVLRVMAQPKWLEMGSGVFEAHCVLCHTADGSGNVGPNLTDNHYMNVTDLAGVIDVIMNGANNGAMPAHRTLINENEVALVAAYAASLRGQNLPGKEPEGEIIPPWPDPITDDAPPAGG